MNKNKEYDSRLIKDFLNWVESKHFIIMEKGSWTSNSMYFNKEVKSGDRTLVNIRMEMKRPTTEDLDDWIELFVKKYKDKDESQILG